MKDFKIKDMVLLSMVAAIYVILTVGLSPLSYGDIQFRLSEALMLLIVYKRRYAISLILGCFVANLFSPVGWVDILFGTLATVVASIPMMFIKKLELSSLFPSIANGVIVGLELAIVYDLPIAFTMFTVFIGEFVVVSLIGIPLFRFLEKNDGFMETIGATPIPSKFNINPFASFSLAIAVIAVVFYIKLALRETSVGDETTYYTLFNLLKEKTFVYSIGLPIIAILAFISAIFFKGLVGLIVDTILSVGFIALFIVLCISYDYRIQGSFYLFLSIPIMMVLLSYLRYKWEKKVKEITDEEDSKSIIYEE